MKKPALCHQNAWILTEFVTTSLIYRHETSLFSLKKFLLRWDSTLDLMILRKNTENCSELFRIVDILIGNKTYRTRYSPYCIVWLNLTLISLCILQVYLPHSRLMFWNLNVKLRDLRYNSIFSRFLSDTNIIHWTYSSLDTLLFFLNTATKQLKGRIQKRNNKIGVTTYKNIVLQKRGV